MGGICVNKSDITRNFFMLKGPLARRGYDWWWHSFTGYHHETGEAKAFFIEYFVINPALSPDMPVFGQLPENKSKNVNPSYVMIKAGYWGKNAKQVHSFYPINEFSCPENELNIKVGDCILTEKMMRGHVCVTKEEAKFHPEYMCDSGELVWDLKINKKIAYNVGYGASKFMRGLNGFEMFWHAEGMCSEFEGTVTADGETYDIIPEKSYGYSDKNWGKNFTSPWLWISSCNMKSLITGKQLKNSAIDAGGGRPKVFGVALDRKLLIGMYYEGQMYEYNFSKFWTGTRIEFNVTEQEKQIVWEVNAINNNSILEMKTYCNKDEMLHINYEAPDGKKLHNRLWNGGTGYGEIKLYKRAGSNKELIDHIELKNIGCEYGEYDK
jgi:hypothetical protein